MIVIAWLATSVSWQAQSVTWKHKKINIKELSTKNSENENGRLTDLKTYHFSHAFCWTCLAIFLLATACYSDSGWLYLHVINGNIELNWIESVVVWWQLTESEIESRQSEVSKFTAGAATIGGRARTKSPRQRLPTPRRLLLVAFVLAVTYLQLHTWLWCYC